MGRESSNSSRRRAGLIAFPIAPGLPATTSERLSLNLRFNRPLSVDIFSRASLASWSIGIPFLNLIQCLPLHYMYGLTTCETLDGVDAPSDGTPLTGDLQILTAGVVSPSAQRGPTQLYSWSHRSIAASPIHFRPSISLSLQSRRAKASGIFWGCRSLRWEFREIRSC